MGLTISKSKLEESWLGSWTLVEFLGSGSFGGVYKAQSIETKEESAVKVTYLKKHLLNERSDLEESAILEKMCREYFLLKDKQHDNIVNVYEHFEARLNLNEVQTLLKNVVVSTDKFAKLLRSSLEFWAKEENGVDMLFIRMELCGINLQQWIDSCGEEGPNLWAAQGNIIQCILEGLKFLHQNKILHRDLKSENVFLGTDFRKYHAKIGDFGISRVIHSEASKTSQLTEKPTTTPLYKAPELEAGNEYTLQADLYSLGLLIFEILKMLKSNDRRVQFVRLKSERTNVDLPKQPYKNARDVILKLTESDIKNRFNSVEELKLKSNCLIILESKAYLSEEFARIVKTYNIIIGDPKGGTAVTTDSLSVFCSTFDLDDDNRVIQNIVFRTHLTISGKKNKLSNITLNSDVEEYTDLWIEGSENLLQYFRIDCLELSVYLQGDKNTISKVTLKKGTDVSTSFKIYEGVEHNILNISIPKCYIYLADSTSSCRLKNVKCCVGSVNGRNHTLTKVEAHDLEVEGVDQKFVSCKGNIIKRSSSKYEFIDCQLKIKNL